MTGLRSEQVLSHFNRRVPHRLYSLEDRRLNFTKRCRSWQRLVDSYLVSEGAQLAVLLLLHDHSHLLEEDAILPLNLSVALYIFKTLSNYIPSCI